MQTNYFKSFWSSNFEYLYLKLAITGNRFVMPKWQGFVFNRTFPVKRRITFYPLTRENLYGRKTAHRVAIFVTNTHTQLLIILGSATPSIQSSSSLGSSWWLLKTPKDTAHAMASHTPSDTLPKTQEQPCKQPAGEKKKKKTLTTSYETIPIADYSNPNYISYDYISYTVLNSDFRGHPKRLNCPSPASDFLCNFARSSNLVFCWTLKSAQLVN